MQAHVPFTRFHTRVADSALDYNAHMNDAAYAQVLTEANELFLDWLGLSAAYRQRTGCAMYTVEMTIRFLREVGRGAELQAESLVLSHDAKRLRLHTTILDGDGVAVATGETLYLHVDAAGSARVSEFPADRAAVLDEVEAAHAPHAEVALAR
jgi:acyl-CoA thioesterase FadM